MNNKFSPVVKQIINHSGQEARRLGHDYVGTEHLLLGILAERDSLPVRVLDSLLVDVNDLKKRIERSIPRYSNYPPAENLYVGECAMTTQVQRVLKATFVEAKMTKTEEVHPEHLMLAMLKYADIGSTKLLSEYDVDYDSFKKELEYVRSEQDLAQPKIQAQSEGDFDEERGTYQSPSQKRQEKSRTPVLDNFGRDFTKLAEEGKLDPIIGREREIERVSQILSRRKRTTRSSSASPVWVKPPLWKGLRCASCRKR
jgi:ATP-dependent Clp protease ATP-binding subunit ClpC